MRNSIFTRISILKPVLLMHADGPDDGEKTPINSIHPLKTRLGLEHDNDLFGVNVHWTYSKAKADKDIDGSMYNLTGGYSVWNLGVYWKPMPGLTLTANLNDFLIRNTGTGMIFLICHY